MKQPPSNDSAQEGYRLGKRLGDGDVYEAETARLPGQLVVKLFPRAATLGPAVIDAFLKEATRVAALRHPHVAAVVEGALLPDGTPFIAMERLTGQSLEDRLANRGALLMSEMLPIVRGIASGLSAAHAATVVHRELRPDNVFVAELAGYEPGFVKVLDFGVSRLTWAERAAGQGVAVSAARYLAPEQTQGRLDLIDARTDQFALAALTYRMLSGADPFPGDDVSGVLDRVMEEEPRPLTIVARSSAAVDAVVRKALSKRREDRYDTVALYVRALEEAVARGANDTTAAISRPLSGSNRRPVAAAPAVASVSVPPRPEPYEPQVAYPAPAFDPDDIGPALTGPTPPLGTLSVPAAPEPPPSLPPPRTVARPASFNGRDSFARPDSLTRQFFDEGERQEASRWEHAPLEEEPDPEKAFDSFDSVPTRRLPKVLLAVAGLALLGGGVAVWKGWRPDLRLSPSTVEPPPSVKPTGPVVHDENGEAMPGGELLQMPRSKGDKAVDNVLKKAAQVAARAEAALPTPAATTATPSTNTGQPVASQPAATIPAVPPTPTPAAPVGSAPVTPSPSPERTRPAPAQPATALPQERAPEAPPAAPVNARPLGSTLGTWQPPPGAPVPAVGGAEPRAGTQSGGLESTDPDQAAEPKTPPPLRGYVWSPREGRLVPAASAPPPQSSPNQP